MISRDVQRWWTDSTRRSDLPQTQLIKGNGHENNIERGAGRCRSVYRHTGGRPRHLYERENFDGQSFSTEQQVRNSERFGFNNRASSAVVFRERWEVCDDACFGGRYVILRPGRYASLSAMGLNDRISSVRTYPDNASHQVSHETIYRTLYIQTRGALKKELLAYLRRTRSMRRSRHHTQKTGDHGRIVDAVSISERPATADDRAVPGHWEGDLLGGSKYSQLGAGYCQSIYRAAGLEPGDTCRSA